MKRKEAFEELGMTHKQLAKVIGYKERSTLANWPDELLLIHKCILIGVAVRTGRAIPRGLLE